MLLAGERVLILRYYRSGGTIFFILPRQGEKICQIYTWIGDKFQKLPRPAEEVSATLTLPGQPPREPAAAGQAPSLPLEITRRNDFAYYTVTLKADENRSGGVP